MAKSIPTAPHVFVRGEGGSVFKLDLPLHESIEERLSKGYLVRVANADGDPYVEGADTPAVAALPTERPALNANKQAWVGWAVVKGMTPDDAEALTKTDLIERFGTEPKPDEAEGKTGEESTGSDGEQETDESTGSDDEGSTDADE